MAKSHEIIPEVSIDTMKRIIKLRLTYLADLRERGVIIEDHNRPLIFLGKPGAGKTYSIREVAKEALSEFESEYKETRDGNYSLVDYIGVPSLEDHPVTKQKQTVFAPMSMAHDAFAQTTNIKLWCHDEITEAPDSVQNLLCGVFYDHKVNEFPIDPYILHVATGNFAEDKAGSRELISKLKNRASMFVITPDSDGFIAHGMTQPDFNKDVLAFLHWKGVSAIYGEEGFDPKSSINNTPRQWSAVARLPMPDMNDRADVHLYQVQASALVKKGSVAELLAFLKLVNDPGFVGIDVIIKDPENAPVSDKIDVCYAIGSRLLTEIKEPKHYEHVMKYISRLRSEPQTWFVNAAVKHHPEVQGTRAYVNWARKNKAYFTGRNG